jgi:hypothetical protein
MDFVASKVAMAICSLIVVTILAGLFSDGALMTGRRDFEHVLDELCAIIDRAAAGETRILWEVQPTANGEGVTISICKGTVLAESSDGTAARRPLCGIHLWTSDGRPMNESMVEALDESAGSLVIESGQTVEIVSHELLCDDERRVFVFVSLAD